MFSTVLVALAITGHADSAMDHLQLLQQKMVLAPEKQWKRVRGAEPLNWIHFPKLGPIGMFLSHLGLFQRSFRWTMGRKAVQWGSLTNDLTQLTMILC